MSDQADSKFLYKSVNTQKLSRAQRRKNNKQNKLATDESKPIIISETEILRQKEINSFQSICESLKLRIIEVPSNGNCLYYSVCLQIPNFSEQPDFSITQLRNNVCDYLKQNSSHFLSFYDNSDASQGTFLNYCESIKNSNVWAGHLEIQALSSLLNQKIIIYTHDNDPIEIMPISHSSHDNINKTPILLSYHKYLYTLGEHYNALIPDE